MQSNAQYGQPMVIGQGQQEAMHQAMLQQQQQYNNQTANIAGQPNGMSRMMAPIQQMMMAKALRDGMDKKPEMMGGQQTPNYSNPYANYDNGASSGSSGIE
jgi:hypothetical protein